MCLDQPVLAQSAMVVDPQIPLSFLLQETRTNQGQLLLFSFVLQNSAFYEHVIKLSFFAAFSWISCSKSLYIFRCALTHDNMFYGTMKAIKVFKDVFQRCSLVMHEYQQGFKIQIYNWMRQNNMAVKKFFMTKSGNQNKLGATLNQKGFIAQFLCRNNEWLPLAFTSGFYIQPPLFWSPNLHINC